VLLSGTPSTIVKIDLLTKEIINGKAINLKDVKGIEVDETQGVYFVSTASTSTVGEEAAQSIYVYSVSTMEQTGVINYKTPVNKEKNSALYNITLKKLGGKTYIYAVHQGTGWHASYPLLFKDDVICRIDVTDYQDPVFDTSLGLDGYIYLEDLITDGDPACLFDVAVLDNGNMLVARQSSNNDKISLFLTDSQGNVIRSKFIMYAKYIELVGDYAIISLTGGKSVTAIDINSLEPVSGVLPVTFPSSKYAGGAYDAKNNILYMATDSDNKLYATGDYTETVTEGPTLKPNGKGIKGYFPYAYFYGYEYGDAGADDAIKREEASALLYRILKQQNQTENFAAGEASYRDVKSAGWAFQAIEYMKFIGVFESAENIFPSRAVTRGEIAKMIALSLGYGTDDSKAISFSDLNVDNPAYVYIKAMVDNGIFRGNGDATINPDGMMTRAEFVTTINRLIGRNTDKFDVETAEAVFPDLEKSHWSYDDIILATNGFSDAVGEDGKYTIDTQKKPPRDTIDYN
jgi:hypothetical protein